jgi:hypothetical protein
MMDQRLIVLYLHLKWLSAHTIHDDLVVTLDPKAVVYNMVTGYLREAKLGIAEVSLDTEPNSPRLDDSDRDILAALEERPFSSVRELARATHIPRAAVYRRINKSLGFLRCLLR